MRMMFTGLLTNMSSEKYTPSPSASKMAFVRAKNSNTKLFLPIAWREVKVGPSFNFQEFSKTSTINGLDKFSRKTTIPCRSIWLILMTSTLVFATMMCYNNCFQYLQYDIRTTMQVVDEADSMELPAITFCTTSMVKAAFFGRYEFMADFYADAVATWDGSMGREKTLNFLRRSCKTPVTGDPLDNVDLQNFYSLLDRVTLTYRDVVMMCWIKGRPVQCTNKDYFSLSVSDMGSCFTYSNRGQRLRIGPNNGIQLLMNVHQEEFCTPFNAYDGIGVLFGYKDYNAPFLFNYEKGFRYLPAGYEVQVNIKTMRFIRRTEYLGRCTSQQLFDVNGENPLPYFSGFCFTRNLIKLIYDKCRCLAPVPDSFSKYLNERNFGFKINRTKATTCFSLQYAFCFATILQRYWHNSAWNSMPKCPMPCDEKVYTMTFLHEKLKLDSLLKRVDHQLLNTTYQTNAASLNLSMEQWVQRNLILANFFYGSSNVDVFIDEQKITFCDLLISIANTLGLFYGLSFTSFFEIIYALVRLILK